VAKAELVGGVDKTPFDLDAIGDPTGSPITVGGKTYYFAGDDDLSIDDRENLRRFSLMLREMESWDPDPATGLLTDEQKEDIAVLQHAMLKIALPGLPDAVRTSLKPAQRTKALELFFTEEVSDLRWIDRSVWRWIQNRHAPAPQIRRTSGTSTVTPTGASSAKSASATSDASPASEASTEEATPSGDSLTA
jgi:hypothetical protein